MPSINPDKIGRYEIVDRLGRGGMGVVYRGRDPHIGGRFVAVKLLHVADDDGLRERFFQEAATAGVLDHSNIVKVYDFGEHLGYPFIVMEFVEGVTLAELIRTRSSLSLLRKLAIMHDVAIGLDYAHNMGIVHRDVKPANLMIRKDGVLKILDFGIARVANSGITQVGTIMGTANYMSPEQIAAGPVDSRSDVFSVGLVFYELLALRPAFSGDTAVQVMARIGHGAAEPIDRVCDGLDPAISRIVHRAIEKDPEQRYQSLAALAEDLEVVRVRLRAFDEGATRVRDVDPVSAATRRRSDGAHSGGGPGDPESITAVLRQARHDLAAGKFESAVRAASEILVRDPSNDAARSLSREALAALDDRRSREAVAQRARDEVALQEEAFRQGRMAAAIEALGRFSPRHPIVDDAIARLQLEADELEAERLAAKQRQDAQRRWADRQIEAARTSLAAGQFVDAVATLEQVELVHPEAEHLHVLLGEARAGRAEMEAAARRRRSIDDLIARASRDERAGRVDDARRSLTSVLALEPGHAAAVSALQRIDAAIKAAREEHERQIERERQLDAAIREALKLSDDREHRAALAALDALDATQSRVADARALVTTRLKTWESAQRARAAEAYRLEEEAEILRRRAEQLKAILARAADALEHKHFEAALSLAGEARALEPSSQEAKSLQARANAALGASRPAVQDLPDLPDPEPTIRRPAPAPVERPEARRSTPLYVAIVAAGVAIVAAGGAYWWTAANNGRPPGTPEQSAGTGTRASGTPATSVNGPVSRGETTISLPTRGATPASGGSVVGSGVSESERVATIRVLVGRSDYQAAAAQITAGLEVFPRSQDLSALARETRREAQNKAENARRRAEAAGRQATEPFQKGTERLTSARATPIRPEALRQSVGLYLESASLFAEALTARLPTPVTAPTASSTAPSNQPPPTAGLPTTTAGVTVGTGGIALPPEPPVAPSNSATSAAATPSGTTSTPPPILAADEATAILRRFADLLVTADANKLSSLYPQMTDLDRNFLRTLKDRYESCNVRFGTPRVLVAPEPGAVLVLADSVLACKSRRGTNPPDQRMSNTFELRRMAAGWQIHTWNRNLN